MTDCNKVIKDIEYAKDLLQNRPEQDTVDYKIYEVLDDALDLIHDLRSQIAMLVATQHTMAEIMSEKQNRINQEAIKPKSKVRHGANAQIQHFCGNCNSMLHGKPKYCSECGKGILW